VLDLLAETGEPLSRLVEKLPAYVMVKDRYPLRERDGSVAELWERIASAYPEARSERRDGLRLDWPDRWVHVRASNTEPVVRVIAEAADAAAARALADRIGGWVTAGGAS
jgi:phosphomannomutase